MVAMEGVPLLLAAAEETARRFDENVSGLHMAIDEQGAQTIFVNGLRGASVQIEVAVVGVFSLFEARMQQHVPHGPFYKSVKAQLVNAGYPELADDVWQYYLAVNVLKHGQGRSYEELCKTPNLPFAVKQPGEYFFDEGDLLETESLINVIEAGFFAGLIQTLDRTHSFLVG